MGVDSDSFLCYPNPAGSDGFTVRLDMTGTAIATARLLDLEGNEVSVNTESHGIEGGSVPLEISIPVDGVASGVYMLLLEVTGDGWSWSGVRKVALVL